MGTPRSSTEVTTFNISTKVAIGWRKVVDCLTELCVSWIAGSSTYLNLGSVKRAGLFITHRNNIELFWCLG